MNKIQNNGEGGFIKSSFPKSGFNSQELDSPQLARGSLTLYQEACIQIKIGIGIAYKNVMQFHLNF